MFIYRYYETKYAKKTGCLIEVVISNIGLITAVPIIFAEFVSP